MFRQSRAQPRGSAQPSPSVISCSRHSRGAAPGGSRPTTPQQRMTNLLLAAVLALRFGLGTAETEEEITEFLYDYASRFGDYLYATVEYYSENTTLIPTMYSYEEEYQESVGSPLQGHLPLAILLSLLGFVL